MRSLGWRMAASAATCVLLSAGALSTTVSAAQPKNVTLSVLGIAGWLPSELALKMAPGFEAYARKHYGLNVKVVEQGAPFTNLYQKAAASLAAGSSEYDIIVSDSQWLGAFATPRWVVRLNKVIDSTPLLKQDMSNWIAPIINWSYMSYPYKTDNYYGLPQEGDTLLLYVRKDMLDNPANQKAFYAKYHYALPTHFSQWAHMRWSEFDQIAGFFNRPAQHMYGFATQYSKTYDFMSDQVMSFDWMYGGQIWNNVKHQVYGILNSPENNKALAAYVALQKYGPPGEDTWGISHVVQALAQGRVFSGLEWSAEGPAIFTPQMKNKIMAVPPPGHMVNGKFLQIYCIGGQPWVVNRFIDPLHMKAAIDFLKWWYLPSTQLEFAKLGGNPVIKQVVDAPNFDSIHPWYRAYKYMMVDAHQRDFWHNPDYASMLNAEQSAWTALATGVIHSAKLANTYAACRQQKILYETGFTRVPPPPSCANVHL